MVEGGLFLKVSEFKSLRHAFHPEHVQGWPVDDTPLDSIEKNLHLNVRQEIRDRLQTSHKVVVFFLGAGSNPIALKNLSDEFRQEIKAGRLELLGSHIVKRADFPEYLRKAKVAGINARFYRATIPMLVRKGVAADILVDHWGAIYHAQDKVEAMRNARDLLKMGGVLAFHLNDGDFRKVANKDFADIGAVKVGLYDPYGFVPDKVFHLRK